MAGAEYVLVQCDRNSSVYSSVCEALKQRVEWRSGGNPADPATRTNLILGDRNKLPFKRMGLYTGVKQLINYYRGSSAICRKTALAKLIKEHCNVNGQEPFNWCLSTFIIYPQSLTIPSEDTSPLQSHKMEGLRRKDEREQFFKEYEQLSSQGKGTVWIVKSASGAKGDGILVSSDAQELILFIDGQKTAHVIQKYIESPFLLGGKRKFDIRLWVLLDHNYDIYVFKEGVLRTSSEAYDPCNLSNLTCHITNHCLQEALSANYGKYEVGNEIFFDEFDSYLKKNHQLSMDSDILPQLHNIIKQIFTMIKEELVTDQVDYSCFQLFGFDFLLDETGQVFLLEVNGSPASAQKLLPSLTESLLITAIDPVFKPKSPVKGTSLFQQITD